MTERPILFSAPMVRALLDGSKTQTRRMVKPQPGEHHWQTMPGYALRVSDPVACTDGRMHVRFHHTIPQNPHWDKAGDASCPYGKPGDHLWVREAWRAPLAYELTKPSNIPPGTPLSYEADGGGNLPRLNAGKLRPSMFMPRWASRTTLEITGVRLERLQDISDADCIAEGIGLNPSAAGVTLTFPPGASACKAGYQALWEQLNGPESWAANPHVWVIEFRRIKP
jgi:hypothetical protein